MFYITNQYIAQLLIDLGADINHQTYDGKTLIHWSKPVEIIKLLIKNGISMSVLNHYGQSPLDTNTSRHMLEILISNGSVPGKIETYQDYRHLFTKEQQKAFDAFTSITSNNNDFFQMCLAYQEGLNNNISHEIKDVELDI